jgi:hypothetical protein
VIGTNLNGPFLLAKHARPAHMRRAGGGQIVNVASTAAKRAWPNASAYHASKWGLLGLSHALHAELRPHNIRVTAVIAGGMRTPFLLDRFPDIDGRHLAGPANVAEAILGLLCRRAWSPRSPCCRCAKLLALKGPHESDLPRQGRHAGRRPAYNVEPRRIRLAAAPARPCACWPGSTTASSSSATRTASPTGVSEAAMDAVGDRLADLLFREKLTSTAFITARTIREGTVARYALECIAASPCPACCSGAREHGIDLRASWMIGDILHDVEAGNRAGCRTVLLDNGNETEWRSARAASPPAWRPTCTRPPS